MNIRELFAFRNISKAIEDIKSGVPDTAPAQMETLSENVVGHETTFTVFEGTRQIVNRIEAYAPHQRVTQNSFGTQPIIIPSFGTFTEVNQELMMRLRAPDANTADRKSAMSFITRRVKEQKQHFDNNKIVMKIQLLSKGAFWYDANGKLLQSSSGAVDAIDFAVPAGNKGQAGGIITTSWADPTANIFDNIERLKKKAIQDTGFALEHAYYGTSLASWIYANTSFKHYFQFDPLMYGQFRKDPSVIPDGFLDLKWHKMGHSFYEDINKTKVQLWADDQLTLTPEWSSDWYTQFIGSKLVPTEQGFSPSTEINESNSEWASGMYGYSITGGADQGGLWQRLFLGDSRCPCLKNGKVVFQLDVAP